MGNDQMRENDNEYMYSQGVTYGREMEDREKYVKMLDNTAKDDSQQYLREYPTHALDDPKLDLNWAFYDNRVTNMGDEIAATVEEMHKWYGDYEKLERQHDCTLLSLPLVSSFNNKPIPINRYTISFPPDGSVTFQSKDSIASTT